MAITYDEPTSGITYDDPMVGSVMQPTAPMSQLEAGARGFAQGATLGTAPYFGALTGGLPGSAGYKAALASEKAQYTQAGQQHQLTNLAGEIVGGAPAAIAAGGLGVLRGGAAGIGMGTLSGAAGSPTSATGDQIRQNAVTGGVLGGVLGAGIPVAGKILGATGRVASEIWTPTPKSGYNTGERIASTINDTAKKSFATNERRASAEIDRQTGNASAIDKQQAKEWLTTQNLAAEHDIPLPTNGQAFTQEDLARALLQKELETPTKITNYFPTAATPSAGAGVVSKGINAVGTAGGAAIGHILGGGDIGLGIGGYAGHVITGAGQDFMKTRSANIIRENAMPANSAAIEDAKKILGLNPAPTAPAAQTAPVVQPANLDFTQGGTLPKPMMAINHPSLNGLTHEDLANMAHMAHNDPRYEALNLKLAHEKFSVPKVGDRLSALSGGLD